MGILDKGNHDSILGNLGKKFQKYTDPLAMAFGDKFVNLTSVEIPRMSNQALSKVVKPFDKVDETINPVRQIPVVDKVGDVVADKPASAIGTVVGAAFGGAALAGAAGAGGAGGAGMASGSAAGYGGGVASAGLPGIFPGGTVATGYGAGGSVGAFGGSAATGSITGAGGTGGLAMASSGAGAASGQPGAAKEANADRLPSSGQDEQPRNRDAEDRADFRRWFNEQEDALRANAFKDRSPDDYLRADLDAHFSKYAGD